MEESQKMIDIQQVETENQRQDLNYICLILV